VIPRPRRLVLLGHPVSHSLSPVFQNAALRSVGVPLRYEAMDVAPAELPAALAMLSSQCAAGNVTIPHKEAVAERCAARTELAERVGAVNTFWIDDSGALAGDNTDVGGFDALVRAAMPVMPHGCRIAVLGAGGGAAAALTAIERWDGCEVVLHGRTGSRAQALAKRFPVVVRVAPTAEVAVDEAALVVNASPVGLDGESLPVRIEAIAPGAVVVDMAYGPTDTPLVRAARARGLRASDGRPMLLEQGALSFERWLGVPAPRDAMRAALTATEAGGAVP